MGHFDDIVDGSFQFLFNTKLQYYNILLNILFV